MRYIALAALAALVMTLSAQAQLAGQADLSLAAKVGSINREVTVVRTAGEGKIYIAGNFTQVHGVSRDRLARLNADGTLDDTFIPGSGFKQQGYSSQVEIHALVIQTDGKLLVGGRFTNYGGKTHNGVLRLHSNGILDTSFNTGTGANGSVETITLQPDGKLILTGYFTSFGGKSCGGIARININGSVDTTFKHGADAQGSSVAALGLQSDGKIVVAGYFSQWSSANNTPTERIARLNSNGMLDTTFAIGTGADGSINAMQIQPDNKMVIVGNFTHFNGTPRNRIARLNSDGTLDSSFSGGTGFATPLQGVLSLVRQTDGKLVIGGDFASYNGTPCKGIVRINENASIDSSFDAGAGPGGYFYIDTNGWKPGKILFLELQADDRLLVGGGFAIFDDAAHSRVVRLASNGAVDPAFLPGSGLWADHERAEEISDVLIQADGKKIIGGHFSRIDNVKINSIARLNDDGSRDLSFNTGTGIGLPSAPRYAQVITLAMQSDGKVIIAGTFTHVNGTARGHIARLNANGTLDAGFSQGTGAAGRGDAAFVSIRAVAVQADGKIVIGGTFVSFNGTPCKNIVRLNSDGSLDNTFQSGPGARRHSIIDCIVADIEVLPGGKLMICGDFDYYAETYRKGVARLNSNGSLDTSFDADLAKGAEYPYYSGIVSDVAIQTDGKLLICGTFDPPGPSPRRVVRLTSNGGKDSTFSAFADLGNIMNVGTLKLQADGRILCLGYRSAAPGDGIPMSGRMLRLNSNGSFDNRLPICSGDPESRFAAVGIQADGKLVLTGRFNGCNGSVGGGISRIFNDLDSLGNAFSFSTSVYLVPPANNQVDVVITRTRADAAASVTLTTQNGTAGGAYNAAVAGVDYQALQTTVTFDVGVTSVTQPVTLIPRTNAPPNRRFILSLGDPTSGMALGSTPLAEVRLRTVDITGPTLTITTPSASTKVLGTVSPVTVSGTTSDPLGMDRVEMEYEGTVFTVSLGGQAKSTPVPWSIQFTPKTEGPVTLVFSAHDPSGNKSTVTRSFVYERRYELTAAREVPVGAAFDKAGTLTIKALPTPSATLLTPALPAAAASRWAVLAGTHISATAAAKSGYVFSHWSGLPVGAVVRGTAASFIMPVADVPALKAVFIANPFIQGGFAAQGLKPLFQGLLRPDGETEGSNGSVGFLSAALTSTTGTLSGKLWMDGRVTSFTAVMHGNGALWFVSGSTLSPTLAFAGHELTMNWTTQGLAMTVNHSGGGGSTGLARMPLYTKASLVRPGLMDAAGKQGYYTLALPAAAQNPSIPASDFPQGSGFATVTLLKSGTFTLSGALAEGTKITASGYLAAGDDGQIFVALPTPGGRTTNGSLLGTLRFDESQPDTDVDSADMTWFRPVAETKVTVVQPYRSGWPGGITLGAVGALYDAIIPAQTALGVTAPTANGNARLLFQQGKLPSPASIAFNLDGNKVIKLNPTDKTWSLVLTSKTGLISGTFSPQGDNASSKLPTFSGLLLQKGANRNFWGFFLSNRVGDLSPASGDVSLSVPD
ncbi:MAG: Calx-beta domain-containing protein [Verrucomicrobiota bacterium]